MTTQIISLISALGIGGALGAIIKHVLDRNTELKLKLKTINEEKYRTVLIYMSIVINPQNKDHFIINDDILYNIKENDAIKEYALSKLKEYYFQSILYASDEVIIAMKIFLSEPKRENYIVTAKKK